MLIDADVVKGSLIAGKVARNFRFGRSVTLAHTHTHTQKKSEKRLALNHCAVLLTVFVFCRSF